MYVQIPVLCVRVCVRERACRRDVDGWMADRVGKTAKPSPNLREAAGGGGRVRARRGGMMVSFEKLVIPLQP